MLKTQIETHESILLQSRNKGQHFTPYEMVLDLTNRGASGSQGVGISRE
jgi:hypothetical protein